MLTRIEIDGFKTFQEFAIDLTPFSAIVGPNASGKSNLFDAIKLLSKLAQSDVRSAMTHLRGEPDELFRKTEHKTWSKMKFSVEVLLKPEGSDQFGSSYTLKSQRLRYSVTIGARAASDGGMSQIYVLDESCIPIKKKEDKAQFLKSLSGIMYSGNLSAFLETDTSEKNVASFRIRQDGPRKSGKPVRLPASEATRTALSTIASAEFPHLYGLKDFLAHPSFLQINPQEARKENDRFMPRELLPDASNLAAVIAKIKDETGDSERPDGRLADISGDLARLIPSTRQLRSVSSSDQKEYAYEVEMSEGLQFSSRVISDGTLRILALITLLNDPRRSGLLCFEEPENGIHEGRIGTLIELIRGSTEDFSQDYFQVLINTHSPVVMKSLLDEEIVVADVVKVMGRHSTERKTRMRRSIQAISDLVEPENVLTRFEVERLLQRHSDAA